MVCAECSTAMKASDQDSTQARPILVVEDASLGGSPIQGIVREAGFNVVGVGTGEHALNHFLQQQPEAVILDITLPGISGFEVCQHLRAMNKDVPILMLSHRARGEDKVRGFELGADDYVVKPFHPGELVARVRAILRRCLVPSQGVLRSGDIHLEPMSLKCCKGDSEIDLTPKEAALLMAFLRNPSRVLGRDFLTRILWGEGHFGSAKGLDMHIRRLREKIEDDPSRPVRLRTAWGAGYVWK